MSMLKTMAINDSNTGTGRNMMKIMEKYDRFLDKVITVLSWNNSNDLYIQRYIQMFNPDHNCKWVLNDHCEEGETGNYTPTEIGTGGVAIPPGIVMPLVK